MGAIRFLDYMTKKYNETKIVGKRVHLSTLKPGDYFIFPNLYDGVIGKLIACDMNATVKWIHHPGKLSNKKEIIAASAEIYKYDYE
tara:strand:+ start:2089 stop:2346 length:258 start_codon:yes stop_codon:yes gene_type:complete